MSDISRTCTYGPDDLIIPAVQHAAALALANPDQQALGEAVAAVASAGTLTPPLVAQARSLVADLHPNAAGALDSAVADHAGRDCGCWQRRADAFVTEVTHTLGPHTTAETYWVLADEHTGVRMRSQGPMDKMVRAVISQDEPAEVTFTFDPVTSTGTLTFGPEKLRLYRFDGHHYRHLLGLARDVGSLDALLATPRATATLVAQMAGSETTRSEKFDGEHLNLLDLSEVMTAVAPLLTCPTREQASALDSDWVGSVEDLADALHTANLPTGGPRRGGVASASPSRTPHGTNRTQQEGAA
jgi:hypothetical protein